MLELPQRPESCRFLPLLLSAILSIRKDPVVFLQIIGLCLAYIFGSKFIFRPAFMLV